MNKNGQESNMVAITGKGWHNIMSWNMLKVEW